ncbi:MAG TPA: hypothetical protein VI385_09775 [Flavisolibacter sp.]
MKTIITLFIAVFAVGSLYAQTNKDEVRRVILGQGKGTPAPSGNGRDVILGGGNNGNTYPTSYPGNYPNSGSRQGQVDQVNREYDAKIWSIRNNRTLSQQEKDRMIRQLEEDRQRRIQQITRNGHYGYQTKGRKDRDDDDDDRYERNGKGNNGKHLGWEKGKGNPHRSHDD